MRSGASGRPPGPPRMPPSWPCPPDRRYCLPRPAVHVRQLLQPETAAAVRARRAWPGLTCSSSAVTPTPILIAAPYLGAHPHAASVSRSSAWQTQFRTARRSTRKGHCTGSAANSGRPRPAPLFVRRIRRSVRTGSNLRLPACKRHQDSGCSGPRRCLACTQAEAALWQHFLVCGSRSASPHQSSCGATA
jgi:hypothetical protein